MTLILEKATTTRGDGSRCSRGCFVDIGGGIVVVDRGDGGGGGGGGRGLVVVVVVLLLSLFDIRCYSVMIVRPSFNETIPIVQFSKISFNTTKELPLLNFEQFSNLPQNQTNEWTEIYLLMETNPSTFKTIEQTEPGSIIAGFIVSSVEGDLSSNVRVMYELLDSALPVGLISLQSFQKLNSLLGGGGGGRLGGDDHLLMTAVVHGWDENQWLSFSSLGRPLLYGFLSILYFLCVGRVVHKLILFGLSRHLRLNMASVCLTLHGVGSLFHLLALVLRMINTPVPLSGTAMRNLIAGVSVLSYSFGLPAGVLVIFFWIEITSRTLYHGAFLDAALVPASAVVSLLFLICACGGVLFATSAIDTDTPFYGLVLGLSISVVFLSSQAYFVAAGRVYMYAQEKGANHRSALLSMTAKMVGSGVSVVMVIVGAVIVIVPPMRVGLYYAGSVLSEVFYAFFTLLQIEVFGTKKKLTEDEQSSSQRSKVLEKTNTEPEG